MDGRLPREARIAFGDSENRRREAVWGQLPLSVQGCTGR